MVTWITYLYPVNILKNKVMIYRMDGLFYSRLFSIWKIRLDGLLLDLENDKYKLVGTWFNCTCY